MPTIHKHTHMKIRIFSLLTALLLSVTGCDSSAKETNTSAMEKNGGQVSTGSSEPVDNQPVDVETDDNEPGDDEPVDNQTKSSGSRAYRTKMKGNSEDVVTLMVYLCGSNLESEDGSATDDLYEMMLADISDNVNVIVETGGANKWVVDDMDPDLNQRWRVVNEDMKLLDSFDAKDMADGDTLRDFVEYSAENFPADRYMLLIWDHGGGTIDGCALDERFSDEVMMTLPAFDTALEEAGVAFDLIGFDCCLMGTAEIAFTAEKYADYMVASQRTEPGNGWDYTPWLNALSQNTSIPTDELGKVIVDSYIAHNSDGYDSEELTLSVIDLAYVPDLFGSMFSFFSGLQGNLVSDGLFVQTSKTVGTSRAMQSDCDLVDLDYLLESIPGSEELQKKLDKCIVYNVATIDDYNGLCLYLPYSNLKQVSTAMDIYEEIGIDENYTGFISEYANLMLGGQAYNSSSSSNNSPANSDFDLDYWSNQSWANEDQWDDYSDFYSDYSYGDSELVITEKGDDFVLSLSDEEWDLITDKNLCVLVDDGEGYIDLGADGVYDFDDDGDLLIEFDYTWVSLDGLPVPFYQEGYGDDGDYWYSYGVVPISYNDRDAELVVVWDTDNRDGYVEGWRYTQFNGTAQKGLFDIQDGMTFDLICEYYDYDFNYDDAYVYETMTVDGDITVSYEEIPDVDCVIYYELYDIFQNVYWTEMVSYSE